MASAADQNQSAKKPTLATDQEEEQQDLDFISPLPDEILHTILSMLNISDAAVTTAVSKRWSPLFPTLPSLQINFYSSFNRRDPELKWVDALISVLQSRKTAVKKFAICEKLDAGEFDLVLQLVCVAGLEELTILNTTSSLYDTPLSVFNCNTIVKLNMYFCRLVVPLQLTGFRSVKSLLLAQVEVADDDFQRMILWCNAMKKLSIIDCLKVKNIVICAPSLSELVIRLVMPARVVLKSVPRLVSVAIAFNYGRDGREGGPNEASNLMALLNGLAHVKDLRLDFSNNYRMILSEDGMALPTSLSPKCYLVDLKKLCLCLPLNYDNFNRLISCLLNSSPHLMEIIICVDTFMYSNRPNALELNFWKKQLPVECVKHHLTTATFYLDDYLSEDCLVFPKFLLRNAGNLKNMNIFYAGYLKNMNNFFTACIKNIPNIAEKIKNELFAIQMASPDVEIMVKPIVSRYMHIPSF